MKTILITGANGFLGQHLCRYFSSKTYKVIPTGKGTSRLPPELGADYLHADLTEAKLVSELLQKVKPDIIIHSAALSKPDECEDKRPYCLACNVEATRNLVNTDARFIFLSTDFVFGENGPHAEDGVTGPLNFYGLSKLMAEEVVMNNNPRNTVVRPVFIYGKVWAGMRGSFLHWVKQNLEQNKKIKVVADQQRTPTLANDICRGIEAIITKQASGVFHLAGKDVLSPYEMAVMTAKKLNLDAGLIEKVTAESFNEKVRRPQRSGLKINKARAVLNYEPVSFEEGLRLTFD